jgi:transcriptional regulator with XRE-family HTH domain
MAKLTAITTNPRARSTSITAMTAGFLLAAGCTGGFMQARAETIGYTIDGVGVRFVTTRHAASVQIKRILTGMSISSTGLARALGVSRQTLYNWLNGDAPSKKHQASLDRLTHAQEVLQFLDQPLRPLLTQPVQSGRSFWHLVEHGADAGALAEQLKTTYENRANQRSLMADRLAAKRKQGTLTGISSDDIG